MPQMVTNYISSQGAAMCMTTSSNFFSSTIVLVSKIVQSHLFLGLLLNLLPKYSTSQTNAVWFAVLFISLVSATDYTMIDKRHGWMDGGQGGLNIAIPQKNVIRISHLTK
jgi:hypothetical protein